MYERIGENFFGKICVKTLIIESRRSTSVGREVQTVVNIVLASGVRHTPRIDTSLLTHG